MASLHASAHPDVVDCSVATRSNTDVAFNHEPIAPQRTTQPSIVPFACQQVYSGVLKRMFDIAVASVALLFLSLAMIMVAVAIRLDSPGPVLYRQNRIGKGGRTFTIYKFRTMTHQAGATVRYFTSPDGAVCHKVRNDPRMTQIGQHLRRLSIDELPQLFNILRGDMSLIGPRPELVDIVDRYEQWQHRRHLVRPGLTGWWQVNGRSDRPMHENTELDIHYVDHISPILDLKILIRTVMVVTTGRGAF